MVNASRVRRFARSLLLATLSCSGLIAAQPSTTRVGIYHWSGAASTSIAEGVERIAALGGHTVRIALSARSHRDYNLAPECETPFVLANAAQEPDLKRTFENPSIDVYVITAYDGVSWGDCQQPSFLNPAFFTPANTAAVVQEYSDFTLYLYRTYRHTQKRFLIANWESDNAVYCGQAYQYAIDAGYRATCQAEYLSLGIPRPEDGLQGLKLWLQARSQGILEGRIRAQGEGIGGTRVYIAPEFDIVHVLHDHGFPSVLYDVLPSVIFDYVSYSAWESINTSDPAGTLVADLNTIQAVVGSSAIIVGETGFSRQRNPGGQDLARTSAVISASLAWGVSYIIQWQLYDTDNIDSFGLYDVAGQPTDLAGWFKNFFETVNSAR
jgi:hypothetical protein